MSDVTKAALDAAITAHLADEVDGAIVTGYVGLVQYATADMMNDDLTGYQRLIAEGQGFTTSLGLARYLSLRFDAATVNDEE